MPDLVRGTVAVIPREEKPNRKDVERILNRAKTRTTLTLLASPRGRLIARGFGGIAVSLTDVEVSQLYVMLADLESREQEDRDRYRLRKRSIYEFVCRRVPGRYLQPDRSGPCTAPADVEERSVVMLAGDITDWQVRCRREAEVRGAVGALELCGEAALAHWWRIVDATSQSYARDPEARWMRVRELLESYALRARLVLPQNMRMHGIDRARHRAMNPVPACGFGPWVDAERRMWTRFVRTFGAAFGPATRELWLLAHQRTMEDVGEQGSILQPETDYEELFEYHAAQLSGLSQTLVEALFEGRKSALPMEIRERRQIHERDMRSWAERRLLRTVLRHARDRRSPTPADGARTRRTLRDIDHAVQGGAASSEKPEPWVVELLRLYIRRGLQEDVCTDEWERVHRKAAEHRQRQYTRRRRIRLEEQALRQLRLIRTELGPDCRSVPVREIAAEIADVVTWIQAQPDKDRVKNQALHSVAEYVAHRGLVEQVRADGTSRLVTLAQAAADMGTPAAVRDILAASGLDAALDHVNEHRIIAILSTS